MSRRNLVTDRRGPPQGGRATLPISFFGVEEEPLVEQTNLMKGFCAQQQRGTDHEALRGWESPEPDRLSPRARWSWEWPRDALRPAGGIDKTRRDRTHPRVRWTMEGLLELLNLLRAQGCVRVEQQHITWAPLRKLAQCDVDARGEAEIRTWIDIRRTAAFRNRPDGRRVRVVDHRHWGGLLQGSEARVKLIGSVICHDHDMEVQEHP
jgi:hypothetical protein